MNPSLKEESLNLYRLYRHRVLGESPHLTRSFDPKSLDETGYNFEWTENIGLKLKNIGTINYIAKKLTIHEILYNNNKIQHYFIDGAPFTCAEFIFKEYDKGIQFINAWNHFSQGNGMCRWLIFNYYLKLYPYIVSDSSHTPEGMKYWNSLIFEAKQKNYKVVVITPKGEIEILSAEDSEQYYHLKYPGTYLFKIYAK